MGSDQQSRGTAQSRGVSRRFRAHSQNQNLSIVEQIDSDLNDIIDQLATNKRIKHKEKKSVSALRNQDIRLSLPDLSA